MYKYAINNYSDPISNGLLNQIYSISSYEVFTVFTLAMTGPSSTDKRINQIA